MIKSAYSSTRTSADELEASATLSPLPELALEYTIRRAIGIARRDADPPIIGIAGNALMWNREGSPTYFLADGLTATARASV